MSKGHWLFRMFHTEPVNFRVPGKQPEPMWRRTVGRPRAQRQCYPAVPGKDKKVERQQDKTRSPDGEEDVLVPMLFLYLSLVVALRQTSSSNWASVSSQIE